MQAYFDPEQAFIISMPQPVSKFRLLIKKTCSDERYFREIDVQYPEKLHDLYNDLPFFPDREKNDKVEKLVAHLHDEK